MEKKEIEQKVMYYYLKGFHCAESMFNAFYDFYKTENELNIVKCASGFGGGIGGCKDVCGALSGAILVLGWMFGRSEPDDDKQKVFALSKEFRDAFLQKFGNTDCKSLKDAMDNRDLVLTCKQMTCEAAGILNEIIEKNR